MGGVQVFLFFIKISFFYTVLDIYRGEVDRMGIAAFPCSAHLTTDGSRNSCDASDRR